MSGEISTLVKLIEECFNKKSWHGTNLRGSLRGLSAEEAAWRPSAGRHNIWEIVVHCAYWKYAVRRRITAKKRGSFPLKGSNWFVRPLGKSDDSNWKQDIRLLEDTHREMVEVISELSSDDLQSIPQGSKVDNRTIIRGIAAHDVYHAGQIQLLKRLL